MNPIDYVAIIASLLTIISVCINIIQWQSKKNLISTLKSRSQASYNYFYQIAQHSDQIRFSQNKNVQPNQVVDFCIRQAHSINGISDGARLDIISYSREHLNFIPVKEHPAHAFDGALPKLTKKIGSVPNSANAPDAKSREAD